MIIAAIVVLAGVVISLLVSALSGMSTLDTTGKFIEVVTYFLPYLRNGVMFLNSFVYPSVIQTLLGLTIATEAIIVDYKIIMWVASKIPMFGVSD